ncbi:hypothetical protein BCR42DRAFT_416909 [Absidia repens]|uniref:Uncharacterized protein n=1 Tax=Absidia repens TaxID=90262 RepID=A0A1X2IF56_9FUNG|nr:hypothetical protein BCR42DRAFT_416909 [Absidia repens]
MRLSLPMTLYEWKHFFLKPSSETKNKTRRHFSSTKQTETVTSSSPPLSSTPFAPYSYQHKSKDPAEGTRNQHSSARKYVIKTKREHASPPVTRTTPNGPSFYQLEELKLAETTSQWEMATLQEMMTATAAGDISLGKSTQTTRPIKSKLEALALQRQILRSCHLQEMADQAHLETLYIQQQQARPLDWPKLPVL